jgi:conjugal transfer mating pair stabilization protein TraG
VSQSSVQEASRAAEAARSDVLAASSDLSSTLIDTMSRGASRFRSTARNDGQGVSSSSELGASADRLRAISEAVQRTTGVSADQVARIGFELSGGLGTGKSILPFKASAGASAGKAYSNSLSDSEQLVRNALTNDQLSEFQRFAERATRDQSFVRGIGSDEREGDELASRVSRAVSRLQSAQSTYAERTAVAERLSTAYERGEVLSVDLAQLTANSGLLRRYNELAARYGPDSLALQAAMSSELASRALPPLRALSGAALPWTFGGVREVKERNDADPALSSERVSAAGAGNDRAVGRRIDTRDVVPPVAPGALDRVRPTVEGRTAEANAKPAESATFDQRNEIVRNPDGTVSSRKSQVAGNLRQIRDDARALYDNAKEGLGSLANTGRRTTEDDRAKLANSERQRAIDATPEVPPMSPPSGKRRRGE